MTGLGAAMAQPDKHIIVLTGDGEMLMGIAAGHYRRAAAEKSVHHCAG